MLHVEWRLHETKTRYVYAGWQRIADYDGTANTLQNRYVYGTSLDEPLIQVSSAGVLTYLHADRLGSIIAMSDSTGTVTNKNKYSPFGEGAPVGTTFGFTGQRYDAETGLYYYKNRHYSPAIGRFLQTDPIGYGIKLDDCGCGCSCSSSSPTQASVNLYGYAGNNPLNKIDPLGLTLLDIIVNELAPDLLPSLENNAQNIANTMGIIGSGILGGIMNSIQNNTYKPDYTPDLSGDISQCVMSCQKQASDDRDKYKFKPKECSKKAIDDAQAACEAKCASFFDDGTDPRTPKNPPVRRAA
jgi:RHS repeat-associated protein